MTVRQLLLVLVAYHPSSLEVEQLQACLAALPPQVGYAVAVNDHQEGEAVERGEGWGYCVDNVILKRQNL